MTQHRSRGDLLLLLSVINKILLLFYSYPQPVEDKKNKIKKTVVNQPSGLSIVEYKPDGIIGNY